MPCSICKQTGHNRRSCKATQESKTSEKKKVMSTEQTTKTTLKTEDTGKIFEMAICLTYNTQYDGKFKYDLEKAKKIQARLTKLPELFPKCSHTAKKGARYDFTAIDDTTKHLSAKTTKKGGGKVAPQVIGQSQPKKFATLLGIEYTDIPTLKQYIQTNVPKILNTLVDYTFDCPNLYYNEDKDTLQFITLTAPIDWIAHEFTWTCSWDKWANSSTLKIKQGTKETALVEFQFHTKSRTNMAVRWCYENFITIFKDNLNIVTL